jgi:hypothetical protein
MGAKDQSKADSTTTDSKVQGEGDYEADRRYRDKTKKFIDSGRVETAAREAEPHSSQEQAEMTQAEQEGLRHRKP